MMNDGQTQSEHFTAREFLLLGLSHIAYVKPKTVNDSRVYAIYSADGSEMAVAADRDVAMALVRQHDMEPMSVH
jgi:hypothetical protein